MFKDARARRAWSLYFLKAEAVLSPLQESVRRELLEDLKTHVQDILANEPGTGGEYERLTAALDRVGDPKEFLAPLLAEAVFKIPPQHGSFGMAYRTIKLYGARGGAYLMRAMGLVFAGALGIATALAAINSLIRPEHAGVFKIGHDEYQIRILGLGASTGEQLLAPWVAVALIAVGALLLYWTTVRVRRMLLELIASVG
jgi:hypothetical protein